MREPSDNPGLVAKPQMDLSRLLRLLGRLDEARECALAATASARAADISPLTAVALENQAVCALQRGDSTQAVAAASEALEVLEPGKMTQHSRARALVTRAECLLAAGHETAAENDLQASWEIVDPTTLPPTLPGYVGLLAKWWDVRGKLDLHRGKLSQAAAALKQAIHYRGLGRDGPCGATPYATLALAKTLETLARVAESSGDSEAARNAASEARLLREQAHLPVRENQAGASPPGPS